ncbi:hypothetical protein [Piscicoccus intestinalis]|uniref:hypothetical protein n=1 Tax=Piscicoccus intestinalis TaxID=746033 RepID=UPI000838C407|nr:hypothetical protein [Piscicoccus intestinalis]
MSVRRKLFGGIGDSAFSALGTFAVGAYAVRHLPDAGVALFSLTLTSWVIGAVFPRGLVLTPLEVRVNRESNGSLPPFQATFAAARSSLVAAALVAALGGLPLAREVPVASLALMSATAAAATVGTALLSHVRASLHIAGQHEAAGVTAFLSTAVTIGVLFAGSFAPRGPVDYALPFGALALGQLVGVPVWRWAQHRCGTVNPGVLPPLRERAFLLVPVLVTQVTIYLQGALVLQILGSSANAHLEGARVAASPVFVLANGLSWVLFPGLVRAIGAGANLGIPRKIAERMGILVASGLSYGLVLLLSGNLLSAALGRPVDALLAAARAAGFALEGAGNVHLSFFIALDSFRQPALLSIIAAGVSLLTTYALLSPWGVFAVPAGQAASAAVTAMVGLLLVSRHLRRRSA